MAVFGALKSGWATLAGDFTPTLNTEDDPTTLKPNESPSCYGVDCEREGRLATGSCPTGTAVTFQTGTTPATAWTWLYNRLWYATGSTMMWGAPWYRDAHFPHEVGDISVDATITGYDPVFGDSIIILTASGAQLLSNADNYGGNFNLSELIRGFHMGGNANDGHVAMNRIPYVCNSSGVFSFDGREIKELTRNIRGSIGTFASKTLRIDATKRFLVLYSGTTASAVVEVDTGKLFDYGTSGFLFTSRTLANAPGAGPFGYDKIAVSFERGSTADGTLKWQSKSEDGDWYTEADISMPADAEKKSRIEVPIQNPCLNSHKFAVRITSLTSNIYIRSIQLCVVGLAEECFSA